MISSFGVGFAAGFFIAAQIGPISLLAIRSTLRTSARTGIAIGAGAAVVDMIYASLGSAGITRFMSGSKAQLVLALAGGLFLIVVGSRTIWAAARVRASGETPQEIGAPFTAFLTSFTATASNPFTIVSWAALFAGAALYQAGASPVSAAALVLGVGSGTFTWFATLSIFVSRTGRNLGQRTLDWVDALAGAGLIAFGGTLIYRGVQDS